MQIEIHYHRPPDRTTIYCNQLVHQDGDVIITRNTLDDGSPAVWFTFPDADHDIARFHQADGGFKGIYANILTPVAFVSDVEWRTTDLFVDVWIDPNNRAMLLDEDELAEAMQRGWIDEQTGARALQAAHRLLRQHAEGTWPPRVVYDWPLERILEMGL